MSAEMHIEQPLDEGFAVPPTAPADTLSQVAWDAQFEAILRAQLPALSRAQPLHPDDSLRDLGLDSVGTMEILLALEDLYGVEIREESIGGDAFVSAGHLWSAVRDWRARDR